MDLKFPHHENEIAQSEAATGETFVNYWMHNGFVRVDDEKMSKSLGNFFTVREILKRYRAEEVRYFILASHYRSPLNYSHENLDNSKAALARLYTTLRGIPVVEQDGPECTAYSSAFHKAMDDDFNTPEAIAVLFELAREINKHRASDPGKTASLAACLCALGDILGLLQTDPENYFRESVSVRGDEAAGLSEAEVEALLASRITARDAKDWAMADRIRDQLDAAGVVIEDGPSGTTWRRK